MAMFGFVYAWYLTVVLLLEIWFDYRKDLVLWAQAAHGVRTLVPPRAHPRGDGPVGAVAPVRRHRRTR